MKQIYQHTLSCVAAMVMFAALCGPASAQTLEESVVFVLSAGMVDPSEVKRLDGDTVTADNLAILLNLKLKIIDRNNCIVDLSASSPIYRPADEGRYYLNHVLLDETETGVLPCSPEGECQGISYLRFHGEENLICKSEDQNNCSKRFQVIFGLRAPDRSQVDRITNATKYIYSNFCTSAKRKSAF